MHDSTRIFGYTLKMTPTDNGDYFAEVFDATGTRRLFFSGFATAIGSVLGLSGYSFFGEGVDHGTHIEAPLTKKAVTV